MTQRRDIVKSEGVIEEILGRWRDAIGGDYDAIRGHVYRMFNYCLALAPADDPETREKIAVAAAFHDIGIWTHGTFNYLDPSRDLALAWLADRGRTGWSEEMTAMILLHHKPTACRGEGTRLVEAFRRADLVDLSLGLIRAGLDRGFVREVKSAFPNAGFHALVTRMALAWAVRHPGNPLPFMRHAVK